MPERLTILFAGGGTGGHLFPGIAVARALHRVEPHARCAFAGSERTVELALAAEHGLEHHALRIEPSTALRRNPLRFAWRYWRARRDAARLIAELRPQAVVGLGGFASVPVVAAAGAANVPAILLEQNAVPGRATRWLASRAALVCLSFELPEGAIRASRTRMTGNPVRSEIAAFADENRRAHGVDEARTLLVLGGSQGAAALNEAVPRALASLGETACGWRIVHQAGAGNEEGVRAAYLAAEIDAEVAPFFSDLPRRLAEATLAVSRAGGTTLAELACAGLPAILVPYPGAIADHQTANARHFERAGGTRIVNQSTELSETAAGIAAALGEIVSSAGALLEMSRAMRSLARPRAADDVAAAVLEIAGAPAA